MRRIELRPEAANYIRDNGGLVPDVWAGLLHLQDAEKLPGERRADFWIFEVSKHYLYYRMLSEDVVEVLFIKPKSFLGK